MPRMSPLRTLIAALLALFAAGCQSVGFGIANAGVAAPSASVVYDRQRNLSLDLYRPAPSANGAVPVVVFFYGGSWRNGERGQYRFVGQRLAESGVLVAEVRATKAQGSQHFVMVDAGFSDLMRPSMYGSFHGMEIIRADGTAATGPVQASVVAGPLCESGDVFTQGEGGVVLQRDLPAAKVGDLLVIHDTGAYGASMSSNYNTRPLIPEVLVEDGEARLIRRKQTVAELIALEAV